MTHVFHTTSTLMQLSFTYFMFGLGVYIVSYGYLTFKIGFKQLIIYGNILFIVSTILIILTRNIHMLLILRLIQGLGAGSGSVSVATALVRTYYDVSLFKKIFSYVVAVGMLGSMIAPLFGGYIQHLFTWLGNFTFLLIFALPLVFITFLFFPEINNPTRTEGSYFKEFLKNLINKNFITNIIYSILIAAIMSAFTIAMPFLLQGYFAFTPVGYGWIIFLLELIISLAAYLNILILKRFTYESIIPASLFVSTLGVLTLLLASYFADDSVFSLIIPLAFILLGITILYLNFVSLAFESDGLFVVSAASIFGILQIVGNTVASSIMAVLSEESLIPYAWLTVSLFLIMLLLIFIFHRNYFIFKQRKIN